MTETSRPTTGRDITVRDVPGEHRYEITVAGRRAGFAAYVDRPGGEGGGQRRVFTHTEIDENFGGQGLGSVLVAGALDAVRASGRRVVPVCPFVSAYLKRHPEYEDLVDRATPAILSSL
ncbi:MAG: GNAT family N-acetyltransferase [Lapillicoccus sp.]